MSAADSEDLFLRHRGAILDALLSKTEEPAATSSAAPDNASASEPSTAGGEAKPPDATETATTEPTAARREPKPSDRINALLSGIDPDTGDDEPEPSPASNGEDKKPGREDEHSRRTTTRSVPGAHSLAPIAVFARGAITQLRRPKVALAAAGVLLVLVVWGLVAGGDDDETTARPPLIVPTSSPTVTTAQATPSEPAAASGQLITVRSAESRCPPGSTPGIDAFGPDTTKAWACVRAYRVDGQVLRIDLGKTYQIDSIGIVPGWDHVGQNGEDQWDRYRTVRRVSYRFDDPRSTVYTQQTLDQRTLVVTKIEPPVTASRVVLTVLESSGAPSVNTTAISSIQVTGR
ncbi:hypothetical protein [Nocardia sp. NPDC050793]|uniref:hypothetical protein n=1 Tax=Nocardia sp. NPDC050793 TaxID=3155159 RepID=UPI0033EF230B